MVLPLAAPMVPVMLVLSVPLPSTFSVVSVVAVLPKTAVPASTVVPSSEAAKIT